MNRRAFLAASAATATAATLKAAGAATEGPFGETGVPLRVPEPERLPLGPLSPDCAEYRIDRPQYPVASDRLAPIPQRDQPVALVEIDFAAVVGDRLGDVEEELADQ